MLTFTHEPLTHRVMSDALGRTFGRRASNNHEQLVFIPFHPSPLHPSPLYPSPPFLDALFPALRQCKQNKCDSKKNTIKHETKKKQSTAAPKRRAFLLARFRSSLFFLSLPRPPRPAFASIFGQQAHVFDGGVFGESLCVREGEGTVD